MTIVSGYVHSPSIVRMNEVKVYSRCLALSLCINLVMQITSGNVVTSVGKCLPVEGRFSSCACSIKANEGKEQYVNLAPLRNASFHGPRFTTSGVEKESQWHFSYNPCAGFSMFVGEKATHVKTCKDVAVARWTDLSAKWCYSLGSQSSASFVYKWPSADPDNIISNLTLRFNDTKDIKHYAAVISLVCNTSIERNQSQFKYLNNTHNPNDIWYFALESECCCPGKCGMPPLVLTVTPSHMETWKIVLIVVGACLLILMAILVGYCVLRKKPTKGYELI